jgi:hypothetical protein
MWMAAVACSNVILQGRQQQQQQVHLTTGLQCPELPQALIQASCCCCCPYSCLLTHQSAPKHSHKETMPEEGKQIVFAVRIAIDSHSRDSTALSGPRLLSKLLQPCTLLPDDPADSAIGTFTSTQYPSCCHMTPQPAHSHNHSAIHQATTYSWKKGEQDSQ